MTNKKASLAKCVQDSSPIVTSATSHVSKAACMFICRIQVSIRELRRQTKQAEKTWVLQVFSIGGICLYYGFQPAFCHQR